MSKIFCYFDFSQIELRCATHLSQDPVMLKAYRNNEDLHLQTAKAIFNDPLLTKQNDKERQVAKTTNFLLIYNGSAKRLQDQLYEDAGIKISFEEAKQFRKNFFNLYRTYEAYLKNQRLFLQTYKVAISPFGRLRRLPDLKYYEHLDYNKRAFTGPMLSSVDLERELSMVPDKNRYTIDFATGKQVPLTIFHIAKRKVGHAFNQGFNFPIQSMAASIMKRAMIKLTNMGYILVNNIHDAIYIELGEKEVDKNVPIIQGVLENVIKLSIPLKVEFKVKTHL